MEEKLPFYKSKTFWASLITTAAPFIPGVAPIVAAHPELVMSLVGSIFGILRMVTNKPLGLKK